ncbi:glycosyl transferase group 1 [Desulfofarcimen acetoxidans DSM 771]|uniref:Glycosyl transferase group 1 n=2 Tax=Desulfofarcimen acetoxidans TaxID=58138 RepID=C8VWE3_DESAS|nr:glycosyl transferase group 1 [Desulfofarcimen acetoxidans DSM 771]
MVKPRILHVLRPAEGGMKNHLFSLLKHLDKDQLENIVACPGGELAGVFSKIAAEVIDIPLKGNLSPITDSKCIMRLKDILKSRNICIMHAHGSKAALVGRIAARLAKTPLIFYTVHNSIFYSDWHNLKLAAMARVEKKLAQYTDRIISVSDALRQEIIDRTGLSPQLPVTVYNGIETGQFYFVQNKKQLRRELGLPPEGKLVGTVARLSAQKGVSYLIKAIPHISEKGVRFVITGDGPLREELESLAKQLNLQEAVIFTGARNDIPNLLAALDVFVMPSVTEGLSIAILEAMASSLPVVASRVGGIPEIVREGVTGILVPSRDEKALAKAVSELLNNEEKASSMGMAARQQVELNYSASAMGSRVAELYREALAGKSF